MKDTSETKRLADAVAVIARTIMDLMDTKLRQLAQAENAGFSGINRLNPAEVWVGKREAAVHLKISQRTLDTWMKRGFVPYIKIGRNIRFKLSDVDEAMKRRLGIG